MKSPYTGVKRILKAFTYSYSGFKSAFKTEAAFRQDLVVCAIAFIVLFFLPLTILEKSLMVSSLILILLMELINTAIETLVDRISDDYHILSKKAKDIGSLIVLLSFVNAGIIWFTILFNFFTKIYK
jgi:diacylglycerol kinase (ATP)